MNQYLKNEEKKKLELIEIIFDGEYNKSVVLDYPEELTKLSLEQIKELAEESVISICNFETY